ncbi:hypothetical protein ACFYZ9_17705 [Streptomyces sp. NPDC001691]|uniref:hypothetical protein n=1 Tax=unclassified Streptomyces TaxID=2593676 RepID=UPI000DE882A6|nr:hypothetical protein [Streptomyces sp. SDr-06]RCH67836.1 hypothetical protein DT019_16495 [Streptomyces sp. SDr-06]
MHTATHAARDAAVEAWLTADLKRPSYAHEEWQRHHLACLALGRRFSAVRLTDEVVYAAAGQVPGLAVAVLRGLDGPVIHDPYGRRFYALVPPSPPKPCLGPGATHLGLGSYLGVPRVGCTGPDESHASYWAVPIEAPGSLCDPARLTELIRAGTAMPGGAES